jgi:hypothetical protein
MIKFGKKYVNIIIGNLLKVFKNINKVFLKIINKKNIKNIKYK